LMDVHGGDGSVCRRHGHRVVRVRLPPHPPGISATEPSGPSMNAGEPTPDLNSRRRHHRFRAPAS
jgi:hypothetical protein